MATDIHLHIEIRYNERRAWKKAGICYSDEWSERCYPLFEKLYADDGWYDEGERVVPNRGFPTDASDIAVWEYGQEVVEDNENNLEILILKDGAEERVSNPNNKSHYFTNDNYSGRTFVSNPDWHDANWITLGELKKCMTSVLPDIEDWRVYDFEWYVLVKTLDIYASHPDLDIRLVYWFDN